jgi:hypothetical protein
MFKRHGMNGKNTRPTTFTYGAVERALADVFEIEPDRLKAFRSQLLHIRNLGVPRGLARPGSGRRIEYTLSQAFEMAFTAVLEQHGYTPRLAVRIGPRMLDTLIQHSAQGLPGSAPYYVIVDKPAPSEMHSGFTFLPKEQLTRMIEDRLVRREDDTLFVVAISSLMRKIEGALHKGL